MSNLYWKAFLERNKSIIVDLMYGQLKSTVKCLECGNISITFDPFLTLSLPITKPSYFKVPFVPFEIFRAKTEASGSDSEEDPDYKDDSKFARNEHFEFSFLTTPQTTVADIKKEVAAKVGKIGSQSISPNNMELCTCKYGEVFEQFEDSTLVEQIDAGTCRLFLIETHKGDKLADDEKLTELNFSKGTPGRKGFTNSLISGAIPRYDVLKLSDSIMDIKRKIYNRCAPMFADSEVDEEWLHSNIILMIKDNTPSGRSRKMECEFCGRQHSARDDICDIRTDDHENANTIEA